ncbi:glycosyltransferase family 4 protein [Leisingera daeponensis]|uniref:glycosyltransferase family 4 protein n=1 Tax=Leisingera daeponensis TaxID=405746 RepID=UPI0003FB2CED|nr:glycosyltransferase family 1 protein [Leisingera daeponensis]
MQSATIERAGMIPGQGLRVACFANQFGDRQGHGLARYARELLEALRGIGGPEIIPVAGWSGLEPEALAARQQETGLQLTGLGRRGTSLLWTFLGRPSLEACLDAPVDVVHAVSLGYPVATRKPLVVTIHDLGPLIRPDYFRNTRPWVMQRSLDQAVRQADVIACVSQYTADTVREYAGPGVEARLRVVLEGVSEAFFTPADPALLHRFALPPGVPFILSAGAASPRKNLAGLLRAMTVLGSSIPHHLVLVGGAGWDSGEIARALAAPALRNRVHRLGYVSDPELRALYQAADLYVHPSLFEGFGLPVLEAMASGTPVVASDRTSLPEVAGQAGCLCDASDPEALAAAILQVCGSEELRARMAAQGRRRARQFSWSSCARAMAGIYSDAVS